MPDKQSPRKPESLEKTEVEAEQKQPLPREYGGPKGREPTRYGDWEKNGRCIDF